jgi:hypothetical protein
VGFGADRSAVAERQSLRPALGESVSVHPEVLTPDQQVVLKASAQGTQKWEAYLAGGAGLALQVGHRRSVDFDWFTRQTLAPADVLMATNAVLKRGTVYRLDDGPFAVRPRTRR